MKRFEYRVISVKKGTFISAKKYAMQLASELNALGSEGWELIETVGSAFIDGYVLQVFKRELNQ